VADRRRLAGEDAPLLGLPMTLKESINVRGLRTTVGMPSWKDARVDYDAPLTARVQAAGAVVMGKTNVPQMLADWQSSNPVYGRTNNPWDLARTPGGSSGGSAAAHSRESRVNANWGGRDRMGRRGIRCRTRQVPTSWNTTSSSPPTTSSRPSGLKVTVAEPDTGSSTGGSSVPRRFTAAFFRCQFPHASHRPSGLSSGPLPPGGKSTWNSAPAASNRPTIHDRSPVRGSSRTDSHRSPPSEMPPAFSVRKGLAARGDAAR